MLDSDVGPLSTKYSTPRWEMQETSATRGKQSVQFFVEQLSPSSNFSLSKFPNLKTSPHSLYSQPFPLGLVCGSPAQARLTAPAGQAPRIFITSLFSHAQSFCFFHLSHTTLNILNCPILLQHPSSLFLKQNFLLSTTDVNLTSHLAHLTPALDKIE